MFLKFFIVFLIFFSLFILWVFWSNSFFFKKNRNSSSSFECGFENKENARAPFSLRFFLILILFLIFDVEISFLLQVPYFFKLKYLILKKFFYFMVIIILLLTILEEWREGVLKWR